MVFWGEAVYAAFIYTAPASRAVLGGRFIDRLGHCHNRAGTARPTFSGLFRATALSAVSAVFAVAWEACFSGWQVLGGELSWVGFPFSLGL